MGLNQKIVNVMRAVTSITKSGVNPHFGYKYVRTEDLLPAVREAMIEQGLVMTMSADEVMVHERRQVDFNGKQRERAVIVVKFIIHLYDVESDELRAFVWFGEADASDDKGINKASTAAMKYFLLRLFMIPTPEVDPDADGDIDDKAEVVMSKRFPVPPGADRIAGMMNSAASDGKSPWENKADFDSWCEQMKIRHNVTQSQVVAALGIQSRISEYRGSLADAEKAVAEYAERTATFQGSLAEANKASVRRKSDGDIPV